MDRQKKVIDAKSMKLIEKLLEMTGLNFNQFALKVGVPPQNVHFWVKRNKDISCATLTRLKHRLGLKWEVLTKLLDEEFKE